MEEKVIDITKPWMRKESKCKDLGKGVLAKGSPFAKREYDRVEKPEGMK